MSGFNGDHLLNIFNHLNIRLLNLNPNIVKGWFDTDDSNMLNFLKWMCTSLSSENFVSPLENSEYYRIESPLSQENLIHEVNILQTKYPDIFDSDCMQLDISILEDEIKDLIEDELHLDDCIATNDGLQKTLTQEWTNQLTQEINSESELQNANERCKTLAMELDERNFKLHKQLVRYGNSLHKFEFSEKPYFINNMGIESTEENFENLTSMIKQFLNDPLIMASFSIDHNRTCMSINQSLENSLLSLKKNISMSNQVYLNKKVTAAKLRKILDFLSKHSLHSIMSLTENSFMQQSFETKEETEKRMLNMLDNVAITLAETEICLTKIKYTQNELNLYNSKLDVLSSIEALLIKVLSQYVTLSLLYTEEKRDIESSNKYFGGIIQYINHQLQNCITRSASMLEIIKESKSAEHINKHKLVKTMLKMLSIEEDCSLNKALEILLSFKNKLKMIEDAVFSISSDYRSLGEIQKENIRTLQSFLICGPTESIVSVPFELSSAIRETEEMLDKQDRSIRQAMEIIPSLNKQKYKKWDIYRRQLWLYFYAEPDKLKFALHQIEEEFVKMKVGNNGNS